MASIRTIDGSYDTYEPDPYSGGTYQPPQTETFQLPEQNAPSPYQNDWNYRGGTYDTQNPSPYVFNQNAFENAFRQATGGKSGTLSEWQSSIFPSLQQMFPDIQSFGSKGDKIRLPNGQVIDAVIAAGAGGRGYGLNYDNPMGSYFSDPLLQGYLDFGQGAIDRLMQPQAINPTLQKAIDTLTGLSNAPAPSIDLGSILAPLREAVTKRQAQIDQPGYSGQQLDLMRTQITDPLEAQRAAAKQQVIQRMASRGIHPGSGILEQALLDVDKAFSQMRTTGERDLGEKVMAQDEARKKEAVQIADMLSALDLSGNQANLSAASAGRGQNLSAAGQLAGIGSQLQTEPIQALMSAMGIYGNMAQMPFQSMAAAQSAMGSVNQQPVPQYDSMAPIIQLLMGLANQGENAYNDTTQNGNTFWNVLGGALPDLLTSFGGLFGGGNGLPGQQMPKPTVP